MNENISKPRVLNQVQHMLVFRHDRMVKTSFEHDVHWSLLYDVEYHSINVMLDFP
jgi:hypothetical protein